MLRQPEGGSCYIREIVIIDGQKLTPAYAHLLMTMIRAG
jgi:hypothetical protein